MDTKIEIRTWKRSSQLMVVAWNHQKGYFTIGQVNPKKTLQRV